MNNNMNAENSSSDAVEIPMQQQEQERSADEDPPQGSIFARNSDAPDIYLEWHDLNYTVLVSPKKVASRTSSAKAEEQQKNSKKKFMHKRKVEKQILHDVSGYAEPGQVLAIMGASGSGKTTLLNLLSNPGRLRAKTSRGRILVNGQNVDSSATFRPITSYVQQRDVLVPFVSVYRALLDAAEMKLPSKLSRAEKQLRVEEIIREFKLEKIRHTRIGGGIFGGGISGGERKRVAIGLELLSRANLIFLDEPTTGLDSSNALEVMLILRRLATAGKTVVCTIHQPREAIYERFDKLLLLSSTGHVAFFGSAQGYAIRRFRELGYGMREGANPADFLVDTITLKTVFAADEAGEQQQQEEFRRIANIIDAQRAIHPQPPIVPEEVKNFDLRKIHRYQSNVWTQFRVLFIRSIVGQFRNKPVLSARFFQSTLLGVIVGLLFLNTGSTNILTAQDMFGALFFAAITPAFNGLTIALATFPVEAPLYIREKQSGSYRTLSYYTAKICAELPFQFIAPIIFGTLVYWMAGLNPEPGAFFFFLLVAVLVTLDTAALGFAVSAAAPSQEFAQAIGSVILVIMLLFGGFFRQTGIPDWLVWVYWLSIFQWAFRALAINQFAGRTLVNQAPFTTGDQVLASIGLNTGPGKWEAIGVLTGYWFFLLFVGFVSLCVFKRPK